MFRRYRASRGFSLVELMIVVAIVGVLAALAIYGVRKYLAAAKTSEAKDSVGAVTRTAMNVYERELSDPEQLAAGNMSKKIAHQLCRSAVDVPASPPRNEKYQPNVTPGADFITGSGTDGWRCLNHFEINQPIYYQYSYTHTDDLGNFKTTGLGGPVPTGEGFEAAAVGDLDGDNNNATFARIGQIGANLQLVMSTQVFIDNEFE